MPPPPTSTLFPYTTLFRSCTRPTFVQKTDPIWRADRIIGRSGSSAHAPAAKAAHTARSIRRVGGLGGGGVRSEEHTSELQSHVNLVFRLLLEEKSREVPPT